MLYGTYAGKTYQILLLRTKNMKHCTSVSLICFYFIEVCRPISIFFTLPNLTHFSARPWEEGFDRDGSAWGWKLRLHDGPHEGLNQSWRQSPAPLHLIQHL